jgi:prepilin-type N-terminal cleavage/methylation domain-containing protein
MRLNRQSGFSMLELLVAMMIIAVIATLGFKKYSEFSADARYLKAQDTLKIVGDGLDQYFLKNGKYPDFTSYEAMVEPNSVLVKGNMIPVNVPALDPWKNAYEGKSGKGEYELKCNGDPNGSPDRPPFSRQPGKMSGDPNAPASQGAGAAGPAK